MEPAKALTPTPGGTPLPPRQRLMEMVNARYLSKAICIITKLGVANIVTPEASVPVSEIAKQLDCHEANLYRMLSLLAANGIFVEKECQSFIGNEMSDAMRSDLPENVRCMVLAFGWEPIWNSVAKMELALEKNNDKPPFELINGEPFYKFLSRHADAQRNFDTGVVSNKQWLINIPQQYDFSRYLSIVDMAGGCGLFLKAIIQKCPNLQEAVLLETKSALANVLPELLLEPFKQRFRTVTGDLTENVDVVADLFTIVLTLHCFNDVDLSKVLKNIAEAMRKKPSSRLFIVEIDHEKVFKPNAPSPARNLDMNVMLLMGGKERSIEDWRSVLLTNGIKLLQKHPLQPFYCGLECELA